MKNREILKEWLLAKEAFSWQKMEIRNMKFTFLDYEIIYQFCDTIGIERYEVRDILEDLQVEEVILAIFGSDFFYFKFTPKKQDQNF